MSITEDESDSESEISKHEKFVPYELEYNVKLDYHKLQASDQIFAEEYERVKRIVNAESK